MSSLLHQAVELAQAGQRDEARRMLWQVVQADPNIEVAWLWLASVAADLNEYQRALNEVLRINPNNAQAQQLLAQLRQQYGMPPAQPYTPAQSFPAYTPPPAALQDRPIGAPAPSAAPPSWSNQGAPVDYARPARPIIQPVPASPRGCGCAGCLLGGCGGGCLRSCLLLTFLVIVLPALVCFGLSFAGFSLGPFDMAAVYLPGDMGRKTIEFDTPEYTVSVKVPRSWYLGVKDNLWWEAWREGLDQELAFTSPDNTWADFTLSVGESEPLHFREVDLDDAQAVAGGVSIFETNPVTLVEGGAPIALTFLGVAPGQADQRTDVVKIYAGERIFEKYDAPDKFRLITFMTPAGEGQVAGWMLVIPESQYETFQDDIAAALDSAEVKKK